ncbi:MAG TPA: hypothetical protein DCY86_06460 [Bdellovibrionales bacterium]|nr:hypothetical protein [Bdellovibrionales bacterium]
MSFVKLLHKKRESGVAILMVMTSITILTFLLADFTFETKINKLRVYNQQDMTQARLNAEAGLTFALAKLRLYQEAFNLLEKNESAKKMVGPRTLETVISQPFMFPIDESLMKKANLIQRNAVQEFTKSVLLQGKLTVTISPMSGLLNPNTMRVPSLVDGKEDDNFSQDNSADDSDKEKKEKTPPHAYIEKQIYDTLFAAFDTKRQEDEVFDARYGNTDIDLLVKELKYYVNDPGRLTGPEYADIEGRYAEDKTRPKHAPLVSMSELYLLKGWDDPIIDLIKDNLAVHEVSILPVNEITKSQLKALFPNLTELQIEDFFKAKNGDAKEGIPPKEFNSVQDFKDFIIKELGASNDANFDERLKEYENAGIRLGVVGKLFRVVSRGEFGRSTQTLTAYVDMPVLPSPTSKKKKEGQPNEGGEDSEDAPPGSKDSTTDQDSKPTTPIQLMEPRVVELIVD